MYACTMVFFRVFVAGGATIIGSGTLAASAEAVLKGFGLIDAAGKTNAGTLGAFFAAAAGEPDARHLLTMVLAVDDETTEARRIAKTLGGLTRSTLAQTLGALGPSVIHEVDKQSQALKANGFAVGGLQLGRARRSGGEGRREEESGDRG